MARHGRRWPKQVRGGRGSDPDRSYPGSSQSLMLFLLHTAEVATLAVDSNDPPPGKKSRGVVARPTDNVGADPLSEGDQIPAGKGGHEAARVSRSMQSGSADAQTGRRGGASARETPLRNDVRGRASG